MYKMKSIKLAKTAKHPDAKQMVAIALSKIHCITYRKFLDPTFSEIHTEKSKHFKFYEGFLLQYYSNYNYHYCMDCNSRNKSSQLS